MRQRTHILANTDKVIQPGSEVVMHYTLTLEDGTVADTSRDDQPLCFTMGDDTMIAGLERVLYGLKPGDHQVLCIAPPDAFGYPDESNIHTMPRADFPEDMELEPGVIIEFGLPSGEPVPGTVAELRDDEVVVDFNHPLAGHEITFDVEILTVDPDKES